MKIAVTYADGQIFQHFGHTEAFKIYEVEGQKLLNSRIMDTNGTGHGALVGLLQEEGVELLICGGLGGGAQRALAEAGIRLCAGVQGSADAAVEQLLGGTLVYSEESHCDHHHDHGEGHTCGHHDQGDGHTCEGHGEHKCHS